MDLRAMLEFARPRGSRLAAQLLGGETVRVTVRPVGEPRIGAEATLAELTDELPPARLGVWLEGDLVAHIPPESSAEIESIRSTGIPILASLELEEENLRAVLRLADLSETAAPQNVPNTAR